MNANDDITGQRFGNLTVIRQHSKANNGGITYECKCDCGNTCYIRASRLRSGAKKSCGCLRKRKYPSNLTGFIFGDLTVIQRDEDHVLPSGQKAKKWKCRCKCGKYVSVFRYNLINGYTRSCGNGLYGNHLSAEERRAKEEEKNKLFRAWQATRQQEIASLKEKYEKILGCEIDDPFMVHHMNGDKNDFSVDNLWYTHSKISQRLIAHKFCGYFKQDPQIEACGKMYLRLVDRIDEIESERKKKL